MDNAIKKFALENAIKFGKANLGTVLGRVLSLYPNERANIEAIKVKITGMVNDVNSLTLSQQNEEFEKYKDLVKEDKKEVQEGLKPLPDAEDGKVVMRLAPAPSGNLHIGHAYVNSLNYEYVKKYSGKLYCRIEDTNSSNIYVPGYEAIPNDINWLTENGVSEYITQSERLEIYYNYALKLLEEDHLYVCTCDAEDFRKLKAQKQDCPCRNLSQEEQLKRWHNMFDKEAYNEGDAVIRFKTSMQDKNPAMRDFPVFRINDDEHPKKGFEFRVWPLMNFSVAIDDLEFGTTHALRGKDHADNAKRQELIHNILGFKTPVAISVGRINFDGLEISKTKTKEKIEAGTYEGWDDIRLPTLMALRRRGYQPGALRKFATEMGASKTDKTVAGDEFFKNINAFNREILDSTSNRYYFVPEPKEILVEEAPEQTVELDLHPDHRKGGRKLSTHNKFYIQDDLKDGEVVRLIDLMNIKRAKGTYVYHSKTLQELPEGCKKIHWLPLTDELEEAELKMPDNSVLKGFVEPAAMYLKVGDIVQLERIGFCRLDNITEHNKYEFWFAHR